MASNPLSILQVNTADLGGGAEKIAWDLHQGYRTRGYDAWLSVGRRYSQHPTVIQIPNETYTAFWIQWAQRISRSSHPFPYRLRRVFLHIAKFHSRRAKRLGHEDFYFPGTRHILDLPPQRPDIVHCHNLHGKYFDLRVLPRLSKQTPVILTLHDAWLLGGHCAHSFDCERWKTGCGTCPYIDVTVALQKDGSAFNWRRKQQLYRKSRVYVAAPSQWLMQKVEQSMLQPAVIASRVIPHGVDLSVFHPVDSQVIRQQLRLPQEADILLFIATKPRTNRWKDYPTLHVAVELLGQQERARPLLFLVIGEEAEPEQLGSAIIRYIAPLKQPEIIAHYYQAADVYIHAAKADNFPNTILEALACGTPVVATAVGGIPEQVDDGGTGFLVPPGDSREMTDAVERILRERALHRQMSDQAAKTARQRFDVNRMIEAYLDWYQQILLSSEVIHHSQWIRKV